MGLGRRLHGSERDGLKGQNDAVSALRICDGSHSTQWLLMADRASAHAKATPAPLTGVQAFTQNSGGIVIIGCVERARRMDRYVNEM